MSDSTPAPTADTKWRALALILLPVVGILLVILIIVLMRPAEYGVVTVHYADGHPEAANINMGAVIDATASGNRIDAQLGYRYKLLVEDESDDRTSGIARIGGRATFIPGARRGQIVLADVTRVRDRVIDANLVRVLSTVPMPPKAPAAPPAAYVPPAGDRSAHIVNGAVLDVTISEPSTKNPDYEGIARVAGLVIVVEGAPTLGDRVNIRITDRRERIAFAEITGNSAAPPPPTSRAGTKKPPRPNAAAPAAADRAAHVVPGLELDLTISEASLKNPGTEGVARVDGLVVFVEGATTVGDTVRARITQRRERSANAVVIPAP